MKHNRPFTPMYPVDSDLKKTAHIPPICSLNEKHLIADSQTNFKAAPEYEHVLLRLFLTALALHVWLNLVSAFIIHSKRELEVIL